VLRASKLKEKALKVGEAVLQFTGMEAVLNNFFET
jgi:hypothetical protein